MRSTPFALLVAVGLAACAPPPPPPAIPPPEIALGTAAVRPTGAMLDPYVGRYTSGSDALTVGRAGGSLIVARAGQPPVGLTLVGLGTFADAAGNAYLFFAAVGTDPARLTTIGADGTNRKWVR